MEPPNRSKDGVTDLIRFRRRRERAANRPRRARIFRRILQLPIALDVDPARSGRQRRELVDQLLDMYASFGRTLLALDELA